MVAPDIIRQHENKENNAKSNTTNENVKKTVKFEA